MNKTGDTQTNELKGGTREPGSQRWEVRAFSKCNYKYITRIKYILVPPDLYYKHLENNKKYSETFGNQMTKFYENILQVFHF